MNTEATKSESITNTYNFLNLIISDPKQLGDIDVSTLRDQKRFARLEIPDKAIVSMSLNRWKDYADAVLPIGWKGLNGLRIKAVEAIEIADSVDKKPSRGSKQDLEKRLYDKTTTAQEHINEIIRFSEQYKHLLEICHIQARHDDYFNELFQRHLKRYAHKRSELTVISGKNSLDNHK